MANVVQKVNHRAHLISLVHDLIETNDGQVAIEALLQANGYKVTKSKPDEVKKATLGIDSNEFVTLKGQVLQTPEDYANFFKANNIDRLPMVVYCDQDDIDNPTDTWCWSIGKPMASCRRKISIMVYDPELCNNSIIAQIENTIAGMAHAAQK